ncbi:hypothetical protein KUTeg_013442 [Tegillarca granosa]|uniref:Coiled-coil domain-containing protein 170 n=1 Tax=Tegillarca granosa TaxID=220873 RepID=A0ABQ9ETQ7_TEGGR|nr:hypothetical protein KUTeg_013442 [Tegillarca granosa]
MASYSLRDVDRDGLPSIHRSAVLDSTARRLTALEDDVLHRYQPMTSPPTVVHVPENMYPRPPSPTRRVVSELSEQVKSFKEELRKKDALIQQLVSMESIPKVNVRSTADTFRHDTVYLGERHAVEQARSDLATLQVKNEKLQVQVRELQTELDTREIRIKEMQVLLDTSKENEARLSALVESHRQQIIELEGRSGSYESAVGRSEFTVAALQKQQEESQTKILELESRLRQHLETREQAEVQKQAIERKYEELISQLNSILSIDSSYRMTTEDALRKLTDLVQENAMLKGKIVTLSETLNSTELETKASRETIMRLVSEVGKEQQIATRYTSEVDSLKMERDSAITARISLEKEVEIMRERLEASQKALEASRCEMEMREGRLSKLEQEYRVNAHESRTFSTQIHLFREQLASLLSDVDWSVDPSEESIKLRISHLQQRNKELIVAAQTLEERVKTLTEQLESQYELHKTAASRARQVEAGIAEMENRLRSAEGELAAGDVLRDGFKIDKERYMMCLQRLGEAMKMDRISIDLGLDMTIDALIARAEQLCRLEKDTIADKTTHVYNLQRKVKALKEQLESKDLHTDLLRKKITTLEEKLLGRSEIAKERDNETYRVRKMEKIIAKLKLQLQDAKAENVNLKAQLLGSSELQVRTLEQRKEIEDLVAQVEELEEVRKRQARKIGDLKHEVDYQDQDTRKKNVVADNALQALSSELRTTKNALATAQTREKQLLDFRTVVSRMLGLDINTLAVPDYEIISRLEKLISAHHSHAFTTMSLEEALADVEDGFQSGMDEYRRTLLSNEAASIRRSRERAKRKAARSRARSLSPMRRDTRVY